MPDIETERNPETVALAVAKETGWDLEQWTSDHDWAGTGIGPVGQHRDSDSLDRSNFTVIYKDLSTRYPDDLDIARFGHWAVGWIEEITFNLGNADLRNAVEEWREKLDIYPVADEMHFSDLEWDDNHPDNSSLCYSDDDDCGCGRERA